MNLKSHISWSLNNLLVPLVPSIAGWLLRSLVNGEFSFSHFEISELAFSMSLLSLLVLQDARGLAKTDKDISSAISSVFTLFLILFLCLFGFILIKQGELNLANSKFLDIFKSDNKALDLITVGFQNFESFKQDIVKQLGLSKKCTLWTSSVAIVSAIICRVKFKLEDA